MMVLGAGCCCFWVLGAGVLGAAVSGYWVLVVLVLGARVLGVLGAAAGCWVLGSGARILKRLWVRRHSRHHVERSRSLSGSLGRAECKQRRGRNLTTNMQNATLNGTRTPDTAQDPWHPRATTTAVDFDGGGDFEEVRMGVDRLDGW